MDNRVFGLTLGAGFGILPKIETAPSSIRSSNEK
jgi:hypothetical protein